jgi:hypothetical protein
VLFTHAQSLLSARCAIRQLLLRWASGAHALQLALRSRSDGGTQVLWIYSVDGPIARWEKGGVSFCPRG